MREPLETAELQAFVGSVEAKSLSGAAAKLRVPRVTVSRRLARLERRLGARLLRRTTRSLSLTDAGAAFYRHARLVLDAVTQAEASVRHAGDTLRGDLRVSVPPLTTASFYGLVLRFAAKYPDVRVQIHFSSQVVDLTSGNYDVALRASSSFAPGLVARPIARDSVIAVASPRYLAEHGTPRTARDLRQHRCLMGFARGELPESHWPLADGGSVSVTGTLFANEPKMLFGAALQHLGIALLPRILVGAFLENGRLVQVLPGIVEARSMVAVVYAEREFVPPQVRAFAEALVAWAKPNVGLELPSSADCTEEKPVDKRVRRAGKRARGTSR
ncbi:MAG TPA: LysR substrate-binding domain-containing protein [Polyangiaceae bacterium]|jgi:DNA-binding transcriptional LysR family regulator|nr:LysR substrate-binding domain-containing protein [Polyangiaceae bacterium]